MEHNYRNSVIEHELKQRFSSLLNVRDEKIYNDMREHQMKELNTENWLNNSQQQFYSGSSSNVSSNFFNQKPHYYPNMDPNFLQLDDDAIFNKRPDEVFQQNIYEKSPCVEQTKQEFLQSFDNTSNNNFDSEVGVAGGSSIELFKKDKDGSKGDTTKSCRAWVDFDNL